MTHKFFTIMSAAEERRELQDIQSVLSDITDGAITHFAPPGGRYTPRTVAQLRAFDYEAVGTSVFGFNSSRGSRFTYRRVPVMRSTTSSTFVNVVKRRRARLWSAYVRSGGLTLARKILGDSTYRRVRRVGLGG